MRFGDRLEKSFAGDTTFAAMLVVNCAARITSAPKMITAGGAIPPPTTYRIPDHFAEDHDRRACHRDADERERRHRCRKSECLAEHLRALAARVAGEIRNVEAERRPIPNIRRQTCREQ